MTSSPDKPRNSEPAHNGESRQDEEHARRNGMLDEELEETFPASDPISISQPLVSIGRGKKRVSEQARWPRPRSSRDAG
jgi:hypothetical protein